MAGVSRALVRGRGTQVSQARGWGCGGRTISRQAGQGSLGLGPAVLQLKLNRVLVAGYFTCNNKSGTDSKYKTPFPKDPGASAWQDGWLPSTSSSFFDRTCSS